LLPTAGEGILNCGFAFLAPGVPSRAIRVQELAGLVTPGNALNEACCVLAPCRSKVPLNVIRPAMVFPAAAAGLLWALGLALLADVAPLAGEDADADEEAVAEAEPPADEDPADELQAARTPASIRPAAAVMLLAAS
jgi:hypothetical protein